MHIFSKKMQQIKSHRWHNEKKISAKAYIFNRAKEINISIKKGQYILFLSNENQHARFMIDTLRASGVSCRIIKFDQKSNFSENSKKIGAIFSLYYTSKQNTEIAEFLIKNSQLSKIPFEYVTAQDLDYKEFLKHDSSLYLPTYFVSPLLIHKINVFKIYEESLMKNEEKCDIREFMDIFQQIQNIEEQKIEGDVVELGSYKGHSGYLISKTLELMGSEKKLYMFDTFDHFPIEDMGIDKFWSKTHTVDSRSVKAKFKNIENTKLIKGDFTKTFLNNHPEKISLAYVDCDSYRSTKFAIENIFDKYLSKGGIMIFEDYGHQALMGARIAFHEYFDSKKNAHKIFSQFSGMYIVIKI